MRFSSLSPAALALSSTMMVGGAFAIRATVTHKLPGQVHAEDFDSGRDWVSFPNGMEFQPGPIEKDEAAAVVGGDSSAAGARHHRLEQLRQLASNGYTIDENPMGHSLYVDGSETYYDEYAQAWRVLGWYIDCDVCVAGNSNNNNNNNGEEGEEEEGDEAEEGNNNQNYDYNSYNNAPDYSNCDIFQQYYQNNCEEGDEDCDQEEGEDQQANNNNYNANWNTNGDDRNGCKRYLIWAAYVDLDYEGNGMNEYQYFDRKNNKWSDAACQAASPSSSSQAEAEDYYEEEEEEVAAEDEEEANNGNERRKLFSSIKNERTSFGTRCVKMDCHLSTSTHFKLLGIFKEPNYESWMDQLFQYEGDCLWNDDEYEFMQHYRKAWPITSSSSSSNNNGCTKSKTRISSTNSYIYYDLKPMQYGKMDIGLYTDSKCIEEYVDTGSEITVETVLQGMGYSNYIQKSSTSSSSMGNTQLTLQQEITKWNDAFDVYKQCQPCKTSNIVSIVSGITKSGQNDYNATGTRQSYAQARTGYDAYGQYKGGDEEEEQAGADNVNDNYSDFSCKDEANSINQCMQFATKTTMWTARYQDIDVAGNQGTITRLQVGDNNVWMGQTQNPWNYWGNNHGGQVGASVTQTVTSEWTLPGFLFVSSLIVMGAGLGYYLRASNRALAKREAMLHSPNSPLI